MSAMGDAALALATAGFHVFPVHSIRNGGCTCRKDDCKSAGKHPLWKREFLERGCLDASTGSERVAAFWRQWPGANVAVATGHDGLVILDVDPRHGGDETLADHIRAHGELPATVTVLTGGGGQHYYFHGPDVLAIRNNAATKLGPGLDVRGQGGYVVAPPSLHESGGTYEFELGHEPGTVALAECPDWLLALIKDDEIPQLAAPVGEVIPEGQRESVLTSLAGSMRRRGMTYDAILGALIAENEIKCRPPLPRPDIQRIAMSVSRYAPHLTPVGPSRPPAASQEPTEPFPEPAVDVVGENHVRVYIWTGFGVVLFDCDAIEDNGRRDLDTLLSVQVDGLEITREPYVQPVNLRSHSSRAALVTALNSQFGRHEWQTLISTAYNRLIPAYADAQADIASDTRAPETRRPPVFLLRPYVVAQSGTILFALPGKGKTTTALLWAVSMDAGIDRFWDVRQSNVLYVNLERDKDTMAAQLGTVNEALGLPRDRTLLMVHRKGKTLTSLIRAIARIVAERQVSVVFLDAISRAGAGSMVQDDVANRIADMLNGLGVAWVALGHTSWPNGNGDNQSHIYGSVMFEAAADLCVALTSETEPSSTTLGIGLQVTKANAMPKTAQEELAYEYDETGLIGVRRAEKHEFRQVEAEARGSRKQKISGYLAEHGASDAQTIGEALDIARPNVAAVLQGKDFVFVRKDGKRYLYGLAVRTPTVSSVSTVPVSHVSRGTGGSVSTPSPLWDDTDTHGNFESETGASEPAENQGDTHGPESTDDEWAADPEEGAATGDTHGIHPDPDDPRDRCKRCGSLNIDTYDPAGWGYCLAHAREATG